MVTPRSKIHQQPRGGLIGFKANNHPQQTAKRGANDEVDDRGTDPKLFAELNAVYHFDLDVAASDDNALCERYYTKADDGLVQPWDGRVWCNPPYSNIRPWVEKAWAEWNDDRLGYRNGKVETIVMLLPANRTEQAWWQDLIEPDRDLPDRGLNVRFLRGRRRFVNRGKTEIGPNERPPFGVCLVIWS